MLHDITGLEHLAQHWNLLRTAQMTSMMAHVDGMNDTDGTSLNTTQTHTDGLAQ